MKLDLRTVKAKKLKNKDLVAGVLYGSGIDPVSVSVAYSEFVKAYSNYGTSKTFEVTLEGKKHIAYFKEVVKYNLKAGVFQHFDLIKVLADDTLTSKVRVIFLNKDAVKKQGLIINNVLDEVEVEYNVGAGVQHVELDVKELQENGVLKVKDIIAIDGVKILNDPEDSVVSCSRPKEEEEVDPDADEVLEVESIKQKEE